ncbi:MAG TPA: type II toxin-antitoxin system HicB family antitoxin [Thermoanaerobaculia bacterium]|nr:type II toxin-antitoxin system HicB family antitoxin [Thermoanaerobaculia bacterium]
MNETITLDVELRAFVRRDTEERWIAVCPSIGVASQGGSADEARRCLDEAVELWFESCIERGTLERALQESNFRPSHIAEGDHGNNDPDMDALLGDAFVVRVAIPAYQATA